MEDEADTEQGTDETWKTEHEAADVQQADTAHGVAGASEEQRGKEVCFVHFYEFLSREVNVLQDNELNTRIDLLTVLVFCECCRVFLQNCCGSCILTSAHFAEKLSCVQKLKICYM